MKRNDLIDLKGKTIDEMKKILADLRHEMSKLSIDKYSEKLKDTNMIKKKRRDIARILTFLSMKSAPVPFSGTTAGQGEVQK